MESCENVTGASPAKRLQHLLDHDIETEVARISVEAAALAEESKKSAKELKASRRARAARLADLPQDELRRHFHPDESRLSGRDIRALEEVARLTRAAGTAPMSPAGREMLLEIVEGLKNSQRSPVPERVGALTPWRLYFQNMDRTIGHGTDASTNLDCDAATASDPSLCDPKPSGFWRRPGRISHQDLASGFGRIALPDYANVIWDYHGPKTSAGTKPGFEVQHGELRLKVKLAETSSEPFTARIFHALGYHVDPTDHASELKVHYSRRFFREFNLRRSLTMRLRPFWLPAGDLELQPYHDPFQSVSSARLTDGRTVSGPELKQLLLTDPNRLRAEEDAENYRPEVEAGIEWLAVGPVNVQSDETVGETLGAWDFAGLGHEDRRELRGAGLLAAWLGWFDSRFDNTRIRLVHENGVPELRFFFTDLGAGMGGGRGWMFRNGENPEAMEESFTSPKIVRGPGRMTTQFRVRHFETIVPTLAFQRMTEDDARWMARLIGQLTVPQLREALVASGYQEAETSQYLERLISRRNRMIQDLGLAAEFPPLDAGFKTRSFNTAAP